MKWCQVIALLVLASPLTGCQGQAVDTNPYEIKYYETGEVITIYLNDIDYFNVYDTINEFVEWELNKGNETFTVQTDGGEKDYIVVYRDGELIFSNFNIIEE